MFLKMQVAKDPVAPWLITVLIHLCFSFCDSQANHWTKDVSYPALLYASSIAATTKCMPSLPEQAEAQVSSRLQASALAPKSFAKRSKCSFAREPKRASSRIKAAGTARVDAAWASNSAVASSIVSCGAKVRPARLVGARFGDMMMGRDAGTELRDEQEWRRMCTKRHNVSC